MYTDPPKEWPALTVFNERIEAILKQPAPIDQETGILSPKTLRFTPAGKEVWIQFHDGVESELGTGGDLADICDVASKSAENVARMAALFHFFEGRTDPIPAETVERAVNIVSWHLLEAMRLFGEIATPPEITNAIMLDSWILNYCQRHRLKSIPLRDVQRLGPGRLRDQKTLLPAIDALAEMGRLKSVIDGKKKNVLINPVLLGDEK
jgi:putative DNA primase/helicase